MAVSLLFAAIAWTTLAWMLYAWRTPEGLERTRFEDAGLEPELSFSLIVPARHEETVLEETLTGLAGSDHPDFEIVVVVGHDDPGTRSVAERVAAALPGLVRVVVDDHFPKNKPKALNTALPFCRCAVIGVFDAEDDVHPSLLRRVDQCFQRTGADVVQAGVQLMDYRSSWYSARNVLEYYFWFRSRLHFQAARRFVPLGGNTVFVRADVLRAAGGWDAQCLAEDCELGVRLSSLGARTVVLYEPKIVTREETPRTLRALVRQRTRWNQGYLQTLRKGIWLRLPPGQRAFGAYTLAMPFLQAFAGFLIPVSFVTIVVARAPIVVALVSFLPLLPALTVLIIELVGLGEFCREYGERARARDYARLVLGFVPYQAILSFAAVRSIVRELLGRRGWELTPHAGVHFAPRPVAAPIARPAARAPAPVLALERAAVAGAGGTGAAADRGGSRSFASSLARLDATLRVYHEALVVLHEEVPAVAATAPAEVA